RGCPRGVPRGTWRRTGTPGLLGLTAGCGAAVVASRAFGRSPSRGRAMAVVPKSDAIHDLVAPGTRVERVASGFVFTEGPVLQPGRGDLLFSDTPADRRHRWREDAGASVDREPNNKANGMTYDADLNLIVCEHETSRVVRELPDGTRETIA